eukprot:5457238-Amphidinium_carterae.6
MVYVIIVHGPTEGAPADVFKGFWGQVESQIARIPTGARIVLMGDFNIRFGTFDEEGCGAPVGPFAVSTPKASMRWHSGRAASQAAWLVRGHHIP